LGAINEDGHMLPKSALIVEDVPAGLFVQMEIAFEHLTYGRPVNLARGTPHVALDILRESDSRHGATG
jgi:hypothetical protein